MRASEILSQQIVNEYEDPELARAMDKIGVRYPYYKKKPEAFMKWAQRAIKHSEEADEKHDAEFIEMHQELEQLKQLFAKISKPR